MINYLRAFEIRKSQSGFTIVELLISTVIFSMILLLLTTGVISFTKSYYKGITETNTQRVARVISEDISQAIQLNSSDPYVNIDPISNWNEICIGNTAYVYTLGKQLVNGTNVDPAKSQTLNALIKGNIAGGCSSISGPSLYNTLKNKSDSQELLSPAMRLANLTVTNKNNGLFEVVVNVAYGDDDLLTNPTSINPNCNSQAGSQFCATSGFTTVVQKRIQK